MDGDSSPQPVVWLNHIGRLDDERFRLVINQHIAPLYDPWRPDAKMIGDYKWRVKLTIPPERLPQNYAGKAFEVVLMPAGDDEVVYSGHILVKKPYGWHQGVGKLTRTARD